MYRWPSDCGVRSTYPTMISQIIQLDENDGFTGDDEMVNVCIATRKDDTRLRDQIQDAMNAIGWNDKDKMDELMNTVLTQQPAAN